MIFTTAEFALFFLAVYPVYVVLHRFGPWEIVKRFLLIVSLVSYGFWYYPYLLILLATIIIDYVCGKLIAESVSTNRRRLFLVVSLAGNLGLLGFFKYANFLSENLSSLAGVLGIAANLPVLNVLLPIGISFHTFQGMSYTIDIYRRRCPPARSFLDFSLFVAFFPQLVAGPVVRAVTFLPQLLRTPRLSWPAMNWGAYLILLGTFKKLVIADNLAPFVDYFYSLSDYGEFHALAVWSHALAYSAQIYADFSGYSDIAIGLAFLMGFRFPMNFYYPYIALGFGAFWQRWHISLSTWFRDYFFIPLGGSRAGTWHTLRNLALTMFLAGLWHGASWLFVLWGLAHGLFLVIDHLLLQPFLGALASAPRPIRGLARLAVRALTFAGVTWAWVLFRSQTFDQALAITRAMFTHFGTYSLAETNFHMGQYWGPIFLLHLVVLAVKGDRLHRRFTKRYYLASVLLMIPALLLFRATETNAFIYFAF